MALKSTVFKAELTISDMDRNYFQEHSLTIARHPSENDERMMVRILAFALHAHEHLSFTKGIGSTSAEEPDIWQKDLTGDVDVWIEVGQPDEKRIKKACKRAKEVFIYTYSGRGADVWWEQMKGKVGRFQNLKVRSLTHAQCKLLSELAERTMQLQFTVQDRQIWVSSESNTVQIELGVK